MSIDRKPGGDGIGTGFYCSIDKLKRMGFQPQVSFEQGISRYAEWIASKGEIREYFSVVEARLRETGMIRSLAT